MEDQICIGLQVSTEVVLILKITTSENTKNKQTKKPACKYLALLGLCYDYLTFSLVWGCFFIK